MENVETTETQKVGKLEKPKNVKVENPHIKYAGEPDAEWEALCREYGVEAC
jgi:hypothetical protein